MVCALVFAGCGEGVQTYSSKSKGVDLKKYKTYAWVKPGDEQHESRADDKQFAALILQLANDELQKKGLVLDTEKPDAVFLFDTRVEDRVAYSQSPTVSVGVGFGGPGFYGGFSAPVAGGQIQSYTYQEGLLFIEMFDTNTKQLLWRGWAKGQVSDAISVENDIRKAVKHIFIRYPVKHD